MAEIEASAHQGSKWARVAEVDTNAERRVDEAHVAKVDASATPRERDSAPPPPEGARLAPPWWRQGSVVTTLTAIVAAVIPVTTAIQEHFQKVRELALEESKQAHEIRTSYLDRLDKPGARLRTLRFVLAVSDDSALKKWAQEETAQVQSEVDDIDGQIIALQGSAEGDPDSDSGTHDGSGTTSNASSGTHDGSGTTSNASSGTTSNASRHSGSGAISPEQGHGKIGAEQRQREIQRLQELRLGAPPLPSPRLKQIKLLREKR